MGSSAPVEYAVAVDLYLDQAPISGASRRVYRISLASWAWPLVGKPAPRGVERRGAVPPVAPLALKMVSFIPAAVRAARSAGRPAGRCHGVTADARVKSLMISANLAGWSRGSSV